MSPIEQDISSLENEIFELRKLLGSKEEQLLKLRESAKGPAGTVETVETVETVPRWAIERYSRQCLLSELGSPLEGLLKLMNGSVLIVGAGGLGSPAAIYLAGSGISRIGIVDHDVVELTNLHRQPLHSEMTLGLTKAESAAGTMRRLNTNIIIEPYNLLLNSENALPIIEKYDVIIDATDNAVTRYLLNDACVILKKPLVSAAALQLSGQLTVYNQTYTSNNANIIEKGPCYRCVFPNPPPPEMMGSCSQNGVLGPVPGVMGCLQAIEAVKIILGKPSIAGHLLLFDGFECSFRKVKLRPRNKNCAICSDSPTITKLIDYEVFCNSQPTDKDLKLNVLSFDERIKPEDFFNISYKKIKYSEETEPILLIDVRSAGEYHMCQIENSINRPIDSINFKSLANQLKEFCTQEVYFVCRRGNDSQLAVEKLKKNWPTPDNVPIIKDIEGGLHAWSQNVDSNFPVY